MSVGNHINISHIAPLAYSSYLLARAPSRIRKVYVRVHTYSLPVFSVYITSPTTVNHFCSPTDDAKRVVVLLYHYYGGLTIHTW